MPYSAASTELYGMRDEDVGDKPRFREIADEVKEMLAGADIGGYAVVGDVQIHRTPTGPARKCTTGDVRVAFGGYGVLGSSSAGPAGSPGSSPSGSSHGLVISYK